MQSDLVYALLQAQAMEKEALEVGNQRGVAFAQLIIAQVYSSKKELERNATVL